MGGGVLCREVCWDVEMSKERCVWSGEVWGVSGKVCWREREGCGERCREVC